MTEKSSELVKVDKGNLEDPADLILEYAWPEEARALIKAKIAPPEDAINMLVQLATHCYSVGLTDSQAYVMLQMQNKKWKLEVDLEEIATIGKIAARDANRTPLMNFMEILEAEFTMNWVIPDLLPESGIICFSGEPGVGKTQAMLQMCIAICLGKEFLGYKPEGPPRRILFLSLEMIGKEVKNFITKMAKDLTAEEKELLRKNFIFYPHGMQLYLNINEDREEYWRIINEVNPDGVILDSWAMSVAGNLSDDTVVRESMAFLNAVRKFKGCFFGIISHNKKRQEHNEKPTSMDDIFGSRFFTAALSNAVVLWKHRGASKNYVEFHFVKSRFSELPADPLVVRRTENLNFEVTGRGVADSAITKILGNNPKGKVAEERKKIESKATLGTLLGGNFRATMKKEGEMPAFDPKFVVTEDQGYPGVEI